MQERLTYLRCGRCNQPLGEVNMRLPSEVSLRCRRCVKDDQGRSLAVYTMLKVVVVTPAPDS